MKHRRQPPTAAEETAAGQRFGFGANWARFLRHLDENRIAAAENSLREMLSVHTLQGRRFLDAGSGSGCKRKEPDETK